MERTYETKETQVNAEKHFYLGLVTNVRKPSPIGLQEEMRLGKIMSEEEAGTGTSVPPEDSHSLFISHLFCSLAWASFFSMAVRSGNVATGASNQEGQGSIVIGLLRLHVLPLGQSLWARRQGIP